MYLGIWKYYRSFGRPYLIPTNRVICLSLMPQVYVQHLMAEQSQAVYDAVVKQNALIYVCGYVGLSFFHNMSNGPKISLLALSSVSWVSLHLRVHCFCSALLFVSSRSSPQCCVFCRLWLVSPCSFIASPMRSSVANNAFFSHFISFLILSVRRRLRRSADQPRLIFSLSSIFSLSLLSQKHKAWSFCERHSSLHSRQVGRWCQCGSGVHDQHGEGGQIPAGCVVIRVHTYVRSPGSQSRRGDESVRLKTQQLLTYFVWCVDVSCL